MSCIVRLVQDADVRGAAQVHRLAFPRQQRSEEWIRASFQAHPRLAMFVAVTGTQVVGYIIWAHKGGFRKEAVLELEQIAVHPEQQGKGVGRALITESFAAMWRSLEECGSTLKSVLVTTRTDNAAQRLYRSTLGVEPVAVIPQLYSDDEVFLLRRFQDS